MPDPAAYRRSLERARQIALALSEAQLRAYMRLLAEYAEELSVRVAAGLATRDQRFALAVADEILRQLARDMATSTRNGVVLTARRMAEIHAEATIALIESAGLTARPMFGGLATATAQAVLARPELAATFRSIRQSSVEAVDQILRRAVARGASTGMIERELRLHMLGADAFPARLLLDRRRIGYDAIRRLGYEATRANLEAVRHDAGRVAARARLIARTEIANAAHEAARQANIDSPVVQRVRWRTNQRHPERDICDVLAETDWFNFGLGIFDVRMVPPKPHPRCILPGTVVEGSFVRGFRSQYDGDFIEVRTRNGQKLSVTPNHPILTPRGFVAAGALRQGDQLLSNSAHQNGVGVVSAGHESHAPAPIENVFAALRETSGVSTLERAPEDLHGDARFGQGDIEVVGVHGELQFGRDTYGPHGPGYLPLEVADVLLPFVPGSRSATSGLIGVGAPSLSVVGRDRVADSGAGIFCEDAIPLQPLRLGAASQFDVHLPEALAEHQAVQSRFIGESEQRFAAAIPFGQPFNVGDMHASTWTSSDRREASVVHGANESIAAEADLFGELAHRFAGLVSLDEVTEIRHGRYSGHVYDLQTDVGYLTAGNILVSNCLCYTQAVLLPVAEWGRAPGPAPNFAASIEDVIAVEEMTPSVAAQLRAIMRIAAGQQERAA